MAKNKSQRLNVALVTFEFDGLTKNGGIGTAYRQMGELLLKQGHSVTVVFMPFAAVLDGFLRRDPEILHAQSEMRRRGFKIVLPELPCAGDQSLDGVSFFLKKSLLVHRYLVKQRFDVIHAPDNCALTYLSQLAKREGIAFRDTLFVIGSHGSTLWSQEANRSYSVDTLTLSELDRRAMAMADHIVSPSAYMRSYLDSKGWAAKSRVRVIPNVNRLDHINATRRSRKPAGASQKKIVFFGRLETRKGIFLFVDAICGLLTSHPELGEKTPLEVIFLGKDATPLPGVETRQLIDERFACFGNRVSSSYIADSSSEASLRFIEEAENCLVCMPSLLDNSPYVLLEAIERKFDFISSNAGGQSELILAPDRKKVLFPPDVESLQKMLRSRIHGNTVHARASKSAMTANREWVRFHNELAKNRAKSKKWKAVPSVTKSKVSIVILRPSSPQRFSMDSVVDSVLKQNHPEIELCVPETYAITRKLRRGISLVHYKETSPRPVPEIATQVASGKYLLFLEDAAFLRNDALSLWVRAAEHIDSDPTWVGLAGIECGSCAERTNDLTWSLPNVPYGFFGALSEEIRPKNALWRTKYVSPLFRNEPRDWGQQSADVFSRALIGGKTVEILPELLIRTAPTNSFPRELRDPVSRIAPFLPGKKASGVDWERILLLSVVSTSELKRTLDLYWESTAALARVKHEKAGRRGDPGP